MEEEELTPIMLQAVAVEAQSCVQDQISLPPEEVGVLIFPLGVVVVHQVVMLAAGGPQAVLEVPREAILAVVAGHNPLVVQEVPALVLQEVLVLRELVVAEDFLVAGDTMAEAEAVDTSVVVVAQGELLIIAVLLEVAVLVMLLVGQILKHRELPLQIPEILITQPVLEQAAPDRSVAMANC